MHRRTRTPSQRRSARMAREGLSLIEIVLALAILGGSMAVLGEAVRHAAENARIARDLTDAQLYCESKMAELQAGLLTTDSVTDMPIEPMPDSMLESNAESTETEWLYSIASELVSDDGLVSVYLSVYQDPNTAKKPVTYSMTRIMLDESLMTTETEDML